MRSETVERLRCHRCGQGNLSLTGDHVEQNQLINGQMLCACGTSVPIRDGVLDLRDQAPETVRADGDWWGLFFREQIAAGFDGFFDLDRPVAPFLHLGLAEPFPDPRSDGLTERAANFGAMMGDLARGPGWALDVGAGTGWAANFLSRRGFQVIALDPAWEAVTAGARFARERGLPVDYICGGTEGLRLAKGSLDLVVSCHALHHIPKLADTVALFFEWLRDGGSIFVDDHHATHVALYHYYRALEAFVDRELTARCGARSTSGYKKGASANEDVSLGETLPELCRYFEPISISTRPVLLDTLPFLVYLRNNRSVEAYRIAQQSVEILGGLFKEAMPWTVEYMTFVGRRGPKPARQPCPVLTAEPPPLAGGSPLFVPIHERRIRELLLLQTQLLWTYGHKARRWVVRFFERWFWAR